MKLAIFFASALLVLSLYFFVPSPGTAALNGHEIEIEVADDPSERERGLSGRESLGEYRGMLFVYDTLSLQSFWMKDMRFSLDFIWLDEQKAIVGIERNVSPDTFPKTFSSRVPVKYSLELAAGSADRLGLAVGQTVSLP